MEILRYPVDGIVNITAPFDEANHGSPPHKHKGMDFHAPGGTNVVATADGNVIYASDDRSFGKSVLIRHDDGIYTLSAHLSKLDVRVGDSVKSGDRVGLSGNTGSGAGGRNHLHFEVLRNVPEDKIPDSGDLGSLGFSTKSYAVDPLSFLVAGNLETLSRLNSNSGSKFRSTIIDASPVDSEEGADDGSSSDAASGSDDGSSSDAASGSDDSSSSDAASGSDDNSSSDAASGSDDNSSSDAASGSDDSSSSDAVSGSDDSSSSDATSGSDGSSD